MNNSCPLLDDDTCKASGLYCFWGEQPPSPTCLCFQNAYRIGLTDGVKSCTEKVRKLLEGYKNDKCDCKDN